jgi:hypothetical protein
MDVQLGMVHGEDPIGALLLQWGTGYGQVWRWKHTPDGDKAGAWRWVRGFTPPFFYKTGCHSPPDFATQWSIIMSARHYATADDAILNPGSLIYEPYVLITSSIWSTDSSNSLQPKEPWFDIGPTSSTMGGATRGNGVALFQPVNVKDPYPVGDEDKNTLVPRPWPPSGGQLIFWFASTPNPFELDWDPYDGVSTDVSPNMAARSNRIPRLAPIGPTQVTPGSGRGRR